MRCQKYAKIKFDIKWYSDSVFCQNFGWILEQEFSFYLLNFILKFIYKNDLNFVLRFIYKTFSKLCILFASNDTINDEKWVSSSELKSSSITIYSFELCLFTFWSYIPWTLKSGIPLVNKEVKILAFFRKFDPKERKKITFFKATVNKQSTEEEIIIELDWNWWYRVISISKLKVIKMSH